jgi:N-acetylglucosaminyldiphosphoundecaprenol N-acetyl-beta-D-mannosaminyltransferase
MKADDRLTAEVLAARIDVLTWSAALSRISQWAAGRESRYVCLCNAHSCVTAGRNADFGRAIREADMVTPDGAPIAWALRNLGFAGQQRINGPDLVWRYLAQAETLGQIVFFYGSTDEILGKLRRRLAAAFPRLRIGGMHSPPFQAISPAEDEADVLRINSSGAGVVFVGLGCPKQEIWMAAHRGRVQAVMIGVGAAFDYHAGTTARAPLWMQENGLEWLHRLWSEPRRLWRRYLVTNTLFVVGMFKQLVLRRF